MLHLHRNESINQNDVVELPLMIADFLDRGFGSHFPSKS